MVSYLDTSTKSNKKKFIINKIWIFSLHISLIKYILTVKYVISRMKLR